MELPLSRAKLSLLALWVIDAQWAESSVGSTVVALESSRGNIWLSTSVVVSCCDRDTCLNRRDGVLPVPTAVLAALDVQSDFIHVVVRRWTRPEGTGAGCLRAVLDRRARQTVCHWGTLHYSTSCMCVWRALHISNVLSRLLLRHS